MESVWHNQGNVTPPWHSKTRTSAHGIGLAQPRERYSAMAQQNTCECAWNRFGTTKGTSLRHGTAKHERVRMESVWHSQGTVTPPWHSKTRASAHGIGLAQPRERHSAMAQQNTSECAWNRFGIAKGPYSAMAQQNTIECAWNRFGITKRTLLRHGAAKHD